MTQMDCKTCVKITEYAASSFGNLARELITGQRHFHDGFINLLQQFCDIFEVELLVGHNDESTTQDSHNTYFLYRIAPFLRFIEECICNDDVDSCVISFALKLLSKLLHHGVISSGQLFLLDKVLSRVNNEHESAPTKRLHVPIAVMNSAIECFTSSLSHETSHWMELHLRDILALVWREIADHRSIYLAATCNSFIVSTITYLQKQPTLSVNSQQPHVSEVLDLIWSTLYLSISDTSQPLISSKTTSHRERSCLDIMKDLCKAGVCVEELCNDVKRLNLLLDMLAYKDKAPDSIDILKSIVCYWNDRDKEKSKHVSSLVINKLVSFTHNNSTFITVYRAALAFFTCCDVENTTIDLLTTLLLSPLLPDTIHKMTDKSTSTSNGTIICELYNTASVSTYSQLWPVLYENIPSLLKFISSVDTNNGIFHDIKHNTRVLAALLHFLQDYPNKNEEDSETIICELLTISHTLQLSSTLLTQLCNVMLKYMPYLSQQQLRVIGQCTSNEGRGETLSDWLLGRMCDPLWETRDTIMEFVGGIVETAADHATLREWLEHEKIVSNVWSSVSDSESYVRASVLKALTACVQSVPHILLSTVSSIDVLVGTVVGILQDDTEAFPRREAVKLLTAIYHNMEGVASKKVHIAMYQRVVRDLDWEVKMEALKFWSSLIDTETVKHETTPQEHDATRPLTRRITTHYPTLLHSRCLQSIVASLGDCDPSVSNLAIDIILSLSKYHISPDSENHDTERSNAGHTTENYSELCHNQPDDFTADMFVDIVLCVRGLYKGKDRGKKLDTLESILDDIMTSLTPIAEVQCVSDQDDDVILDCY